MDTRSLPLLVPLALALALACAGPRPDRSSVSPVGPVAAGGDVEAEPVQREPEPPPAWTEAFLRNSALLADRVHVEGPHGLLHHIAVVSDQESFEHSTETRAEGLVQITRVREDLTYPPQIRAQLDQMTIMALRELVVIERPGDVPVRVIARGDAYWQDPITGKEQRGAELTFTGEVGETAASPTPEGER